MFRAVSIAALACLVACEAHPRPRGEVTLLGEVGKLEELAVRGDWLYATVMRDEPAVDGKPSMAGPIDIWKARRTGGDATKVAADLPPGVTAFAEDTVYVAGTDGSVTAVDLETGAATPLAQLGTYLYAITVTAELVVVTTAQGMVRLRRINGVPVLSPPMAAALGPIDRLATDGARVAGASIATGAVIAVDADGRVTPLGEPQNRPTCLGVTPTHTFWARDLDGHKSELVGIAHGGTAVDVITALDSSFPTCTSWKERIYVADERQLRVVVPGAAAKKVAVTGWVPALTATEDGLYYGQMISAGWEIRVQRTPS